MDEPLAVGTFARADFVEECDRSLFKETGANAGKHIVAGVSFKDDVVDAVAVQQLPEQQSRGSRANDRYFCPQHLLRGLL